MSFYVLRTQSRYEFKAENELNSLGFEAYCPKMKVKVKQSRYKKSKKVEFQDRPLFNGYLFFSFAELNQNWLGLKEVKYVQGWLQNKGTPMVISTNTIDKLKRDEQFGINNQKSQRQILKEGQVVRIIEGLLKGQKARLERIRGNEARVDLEHSFTGFKTASVPIAMLEVCDG